MEEVAEGEEEVAEEAEEVSAQASADVAAPAAQYTTTLNNTRESYVVCLAALQLLVGVQVLPLVGAVQLEGFAGPIRGPFK